MPVQYTLFGRPVPIRALPRRFILLLSIVGLFIFTLILFGPPASVKAIPYAENIKDSLTVNPKYNPFGPSVHKPPPEQTNSTWGAVSWLTDWKWRNPFSSSVTLDENRAVLPPLKKRYPVYTFYDDSLKKDEATKKAENELLLIWRRAWWAQGFKPIVLSRAEALGNPMHAAIQRLKSNANNELEVDMARWLAWGSMGTGILVNWLAVPMGAYQDDLLAYLRRGEYPPGITRFGSLGNGMFHGDKDSINEVLNKLMQKSPEQIGNASTVTDLEDFKVEEKANAIAYYSRKTINEKYKVVADKLAANGTADAFQMLGKLINGHLQVTWQNTFSDGVAVLQPLPQHTTALVTEALDIARNLTQCPDTPMPSSCPPNQPQCRPCVANRQEIQFLEHYRNISTLYTIGSVPHPYTLTSLHYQKDNIDASFLRREVGTQRDPWLFAVTKEILGTGVSGEARVVRFKESVAGAHGVSHSLWLTAERESHADLDWIFGFRLPRDAPDPMVPKTTRPLKLKTPPPSDDELKVEKERLAKARTAIKSEMRGVVMVKEMVEAWNLADTEAWKFARAFSARRKVEREKWEEEEQRFAGAESRRSGWRWLDGK